MGRQLFIYLICLSSLFSGIAWAKTSSDSSSISIQLTINQPISNPQTCNFEINNNRLNTFNLGSNVCKFNSAKLIKKATQLASREFKQSTNEEPQLVILTVTAP